MADRYRRFSGEGSWRDREARERGRGAYGRDDDYRYRERSGGSEAERNYRPWARRGHGAESAGNYRETESGRRASSDYGSRDYDLPQEGDWEPQYGTRRTAPERDLWGQEEGGEESYGYDHYGYGPARYDEAGRGFQSFTSEDQGGRDFVAGGQRPYGGYGRGFGGYSAAYFPGHPFGAAPHKGYAGAYEDRSFTERAGDRISRWFGRGHREHDEEDYRGHGPANYTRSDERIREDVSDQLTDDWGVDARKITVTVSNGEVTLDGTVNSRRQKHRAERCVEHIAGVHHVQNNLRVDASADFDTGPDRTGSQKTPGSLS